MTDDVKVLREAADVCAQFGKEADGEMAAITPAMARGLSVVCARMADMIEREKEQEQAPPATGHPIHPASYDEGWNAALDTAIKEAGLALGVENPFCHGHTILRMLRALRRDART